MLFSEIGLCTYNMIPKFLVHTFVKIFQNIFRKLCSSHFSVLCICINMECQPFFTDCFCSVFLIKQVNQVLLIYLVYCSHVRIAWAKRFRLFYKMYCLNQLCLITRGPLLVLGIFISHRFSFAESLFTYSSHVSVRNQNHILHFLVSSTLLLCLHVIVASFFMFIERYVFLFYGFNFQACAI